MHRPALALPLLIALATLPAPAAEPLVPAIDGDWWTIARDPDVGDRADPRMQVVDFAIWRAADGTWQVLSCIRNTQAPGRTRLLHRWEGARLTDADWPRKGIAMEAEASLGETPGGLQAPHVIRLAEAYEMFYGDWVNICRAGSTDGKAFARFRRADGKTGMFGEGPDANARDPMVLRVGEEWFCYYTAHPGRKGAVYCRRSKDLATWGESKIVAAGGEATDGPFAAECPHVVWVEEAKAYYLFRTQRYGQNAITRVYRSADPLDFGVNDDSKLVARLPVAAPEIVRHDGQWYIAALGPELRSIRVARLTWGR